MATETLRPNAYGDETSIIGQTPPNDSWAAEAEWVLGELVKAVAVPSGLTYECTTAGTSGATEPTWGTVVGGTTNDGTVIWTCRSYHWDKVDEAEADDSTTVVFAKTASYLRDLYNLPAHSVGSGTINFIKIYFKIRKTSGTTAYAKPSLKSDSTVTDGTEVPHTTTTFATYSQQWNTNPATVSDPWTWDDIDALQIGVSLNGDGTSYAHCTQVYVEVGYATKQAVGGGAITPTGALGLLTKIATGAGSITPAGALGLLIKIATGGGSITPAGALTSIKRFLLTVGSGAITPTGALGRKIAISIGAGAITPAGTLGRKIAIAVGAGAITPASTLGRKILLAVGAGAVTPIGALGRKIAIAVGSGAITPAGVLSPIVVRILSIASSIASALKITPSKGSALTIDSSIASALTITSDIARK